MDRVQQNDQAKAYRFFATIFRDEPTMSAVTATVAPAFVEAVRELETLLPALCGMAERLAARAQSPHDLHTELRYEYADLSERWRKPGVSV